MGLADGGKRLLPSIIAAERGHNRGQAHGHYITAMLLRRLACYPRPMTTTAKLGRPRLKLDTERIRQLAAFGLTAEQIADRLGCSRRLLFERAKEDPMVRKAFDEGLAAGVEKVASALFRSATEGGSVAAMALWLRCKAGWTPKAGVVSVSVAPAIVPAPIDDHVFRMADAQRALRDAPWDEEEDD